MCGRFNILEAPGVKELLEYVGIYIPNMPPAQYNISPTDQVPVIHQHESANRLSAMRWWLVPHWSSGPSTEYAMFNARAENLEKSRAYRGPFRYRRSIVPASSFIEWQGTGGHKTPYLVEKSGSPLALASVWDSWSDGTEDILSCSIVTTDASEGFRCIHSRMPLILEPDQFSTWLDEESDLNEVRDILQPYRGTLCATRIDKNINNPSNKEEPKPTGKRIELLAS